MPGRHASSTYRAALGESPLLWSVELRHATWQASSTDGAGEVCRCPRDALEVGSIEAVGVVGRSGDVVIAGTSGLLDTKVLLFLHQQHGCLSVS